MGDISVGGAVCQLFSACRREAGVCFFLLLKSGIKLRQHHFMGGFLKTKLLFLCLTQHRKFHFSMNGNFYVKRNNDFFFFQWQSHSSNLEKSQFTPVQIKPLSVFQPDASLRSSAVHETQAVDCSQAT